MTELVRVPLGAGEYIVAEVDKLDLPGDEVVLASPEPGKAIAQLPGRLEVSLRSIRPVVTELVEALKGSGPETINVEFGVKIGGETGVILAKGTAEVNFKVSLEWKRASGDGSAEGA